MNIQEVLRPIYSPKGQTTLLSAVVTGDYSSISNPSGDGATLKEAERALASAKGAQSACSSDSAWWGFQGDVSYWSAVVNILKAATITGFDDLPDVPAPKLDGVVMDACSHVEKYGRAVLEAAELKGKRNAQNKATENRDTADAGLVFEKHETDRDVILISGDINGYIEWGDFFSESRRFTKAQLLAIAARMTEQQP